MIEDIRVIPCKSLGMVKCPRCLHFHYATLNYDLLCNRCVAIICQHYKHTDHYKGILENLEERFLKPEDNPEWETILNCEKA